MSRWQKTKHPGVYERHRTKCPRAEDHGARCRCDPRYRAQRWSSAEKKPVFSPTYANVSEALRWLSLSRPAAEQLRSERGKGRTFGELADEWRTGVANGTIGKRHGNGRYSETTWAGYVRSLDYTLLAPDGENLRHVPASELTAAFWQEFVDRLGRQGLRRSRIANHISVVSAIYGWASRPTRRASSGITHNPTVGVELPPVDEQKRLRVCAPEEVEALLGALEEPDALVYAIAFYCGLRRGELYRLQWSDVDTTSWGSLRVGRAKSEAGTGRRVPIPDPLARRLRAAWERQGRPTEGPVLEVSVQSGKLAARCKATWEGGTPSLQPIGLHECRHTYASFLMAAGYNLKHLMEYLGHSSLQATQRYVKLLPQGGEHDPEERLNAYLRGAQAA